MIKKPVSRRCIFCFEVFRDPLNAHYKDPNKPGANSNCKDTYTLIADGFKQGKTGVWEK